MRDRGAGIVLRGNARWRGQRVGLLGGSFNPAHAGHVQISLHALKHLHLDAVWWLVSPQNPLKSPVDMAPLAVRAAKARQVARHPRILVSTVEATLGTRYTVDTVTALQHRHRQTRFVWLMGADSLASLHRWKQWRRLVRQVEMAVFPRPDFMTGLGMVPAMRLLRGRVTFIPMPMTDLSATEIRRHTPHWAAELVSLPVTR